MQAPTITPTEDAQDPLAEMTLGEIALLWSRLLPVFPVHSVDADGDCSCGNRCDDPTASDPTKGRGKHPRLPNGFHGASTNTEIIASWWRRWPDANIGGVTGHGLTVIDIDGPEGETSAALWNLPPTMSTRTGRGRHLFYREPPGYSAGNTKGGEGARSLGESVDTRGRGGYVVLAGSTHRSGTRYVLVDGDLATLPANVAAHLSKKAGAASPGAAMDVPHRAVTPQADAQYLRMVTRITERVRNAPGGQRHRRIRDGARFLAGYYHMQGAMDADDVLRWIDEAIDDVFADHPGRIETEQRTARDGWCDGLANPFPSMPGQIQNTPDGQPYVVAFDGKAGSFIATSGAHGSDISGYVWVHKDYVVSRLLREWPGIPAYVEKADGSGERRMSPVEALESFGDAWANRVIFSYTANSGYDEDTGSLTLSATFAPTPQPVHHEEIATWLKHLAGDREGVLRAWLAAYPLLDRPTAGLVLTGEPGTGKGLLAAGLSEYFGVPPVDYAVATRRFNEELRFSPLVWLDEDTAAKGRSGPFRSLIANRTHPIEVKNGPTGTLLGCPRVYISANEDDPTGLADEAHSAASEVAIGTRLVFVKARAEARHYLESLGGDDCTHSNNWPRKIAEHVEWLRLHNGAERGSRLLVQGDGEAWVRDVASRKGVAGQIREILEDTLPDLLTEDEDTRCRRTAALNAAGVKAAYLAWSDRAPKCVLVSNRALRAQWQQLTGESSAPSHVDITRALRRLAGEDAVQLALGATKTRVRVFRIPLGSLTIAAGGTE